jgi:hypothetical protein
VVCGVLRSATPTEKEERGFERVIEHLEPATFGWLGGERLLHRIAAGVWAAHAPAMRELRVPIEPPTDDAAPDVGDPELLVATWEARTNTAILRDVLRPVWEGDAASRLPAAVRLLSTEGKPVEVPLTLDREALDAAARAWLLEGAGAIRQTLATALAKIGKQPDPYAGLHVFLGGRMGMSAILGEEIARELPASAKLHRFVEPDRTNLSAPTVKTATALGALAMRLERVGALPRAEERDTFQHRVGRARHGQLSAVLEPGLEYDAWREVGACPKPDVELLYMVATPDDEVAADDPRVHRAVCALGPDAVGKRLYLRAVSPTRVEVTVGAPGGEPDEGAPRWGVDLRTGVAEPIAAR